MTTRVEVRITTTALTVALSIIHINCYYTSEID